MATESRMTTTQGQSLAYISLYRRLHRESPSEKDMQRYFRVTPPTVHQMVLQLERKGRIERIPRQPRSNRVLVDEMELPELQRV